MLKGKGKRVGVAEKKSTFSDKGPGGGKGDKIKIFGIRVNIWHTKMLWYLFI